MLLLLGLPACGNVIALDVVCNGEMKRLEYNDSKDQMTFVERFVISDKYELASYCQKDGRGEWIGPKTAEYKESPGSFVIYIDNSMYNVMTAVTIYKKDPSIASIWDKGEDCIEHGSYTCASN